MSTHIAWKPAFLATPAPARAFARLADVANPGALRTLADFADPLARDAAGVIALFPAAQRGAGPLPPAFACPAQPDDFVGALVAAQDRDTAIAEAAGRAATFLRATREGPVALPLRLDLFDIEGDFAETPTDGADGVLFDSPHRPGHACVAVFRPAAVRHRGEQARLLLEWDGERIAAVYERLALP